MRIEVYDPAMCCSTGVCGPDVDDVLSDFANDVKWLKSQGVQVNRFNLGQEPAAFKENPEVLSRLQKSGSDILPVIFINGQIISEGSYPDRQQLSEWLSKNSNTSTNSIDQTPDTTPEILNNLEKAVTVGNESEVRSLFKRGEGLNIPIQELVQAMQNGINIRQNITQSTLQTANELLGISANGCAPGSGCC